LTGRELSRDLQATPLGPRPLLRVRVRPRPPLRPRPLLRVRATAVARVRLRVSYQVT